MLFLIPHSIVSAIGGGREQEISHTRAAYQEVARRIAKATPDTLVISSPSHRDVSGLPPHCWRHPCAGNICTVRCLSRRQLRNIRLRVRARSFVSLLKPNNSLPVQQAGERDPSSIGAYSYPYISSKAAWEKFIPALLPTSMGCHSFPARLFAWVYLEFLQKITTAWACLCNKLPRSSGGALFMFGFGRSFPQTCSGRPLWLCSRRSSVRRACGRCIPHRRLSQASYRRPQHV